MYSTSSKSKTESVFCWNALIEYVCTAMTLNRRIVRMRANNVLLLLLLILLIILDYIVHVGTSNIIRAWILATLGPDTRLLVFMAQRRASVCHLWLIAALVAQIQTVRVPHLFTDLAVRAVDVVVHELRFWHDSFVCLLTNFWRARSNRLLQTTCTLTMAHLLTLVRNAFRSGQLIGLAQVIPSLMLHDKQLALLITVHLRGVRHPDVVEGRSLPWQGPQLGIHGRVDRRAKILGWIQLILFDV